MKPFIPIGVFAFVLLTGCGRESEQVNNSGVTPEEAVALDNAAEMLDTSADSLIAPDDAQIGNGEMPADAADLSANEEAEAEAQ